MTKSGKKVTIEDIARVTGVSRGTVSRAFNQRSDINRETRRKVLDAARKLNYLPNPSARGLAKGKSECIGVVVPNLLNPFLAEMVTILEMSAREAGMSAMLGIADQDPELQEKVLIRMASGQVDGVVITPCEDEQSIRQLNWINKRVPVICLKQFEGLECDTVMSNDAVSVRLVLEHLAELGHRKIAYVSPQQPPWSVAQRLNAYQSAVDSLDNGYSHHIICAYNDYQDDDSAFEPVVKELLRLNKKDGVTAVLAYNDIIAMQLVKKLQKKGCRVPDELSVAGIDNISFSQFSAVPLTSAAADIHHFCHAAMETLMRRLENGSGDEIHNVMLKPALYARESTRAVSTGCCSDA